MNQKDFDGSNPFWAYYAAKLCSRAYDPTSLLGVEAAGEMLCGDNATVGFRQVENSVPATLRIVGNDGLIIVVSGITSLVQANYINLSYLDLLVTRATRYMASWFDESAQQLFRQLRILHHAAGRNVYIFGHSGGGGIALALAATLRQHKFDNEVHVCTFGAPRVCQANSFPFLANVEIVRWMNTGDDVPRLPPKISDMTDLSFLASIHLFPLWIRWVHSDGGLSLSHQGVVEARQVPEPDHLLSVGTFPVRYLLNGELFGSPHAIAEYIRRLGLALPNKLGDEVIKEIPAFSVVELPEMFQALTIDIGVSLGDHRVAGVESRFANPPITFAIQQREAEISSLIRRCR
jgi:pimeloyl-ACP methyl ester carboxylesterase